MSRYRKLPEISKTELQSSNEYLRFKSKIHNHPAPIVVKPSINSFGHHLKNSSYINDSPYARSHSLNKTRSTSVIKIIDKNPIKLRSGSPQLKKNASNSKIQLKLKNKRGFATASHSNIAHQSMSYIEPYKKHPKSRTPIGVNLSFSNSFTAPTQDSQRVSNISNNESEYSENKLMAKLKELSKTESQCIMNNDKFDVYRKIFLEVIEKDKTYGNLLLKIKNAYEEYIAVCSFNNNQANNADLRQEANDLNEKLRELLADRKMVYKKVEKLAKENVELSRSLEESESGYGELQEKLLLISKTKTDDLPKDDKSWKYIVAENKLLVDMCKQMKEELKLFRTKEKKLLKLILAMKKRGYPVEEVYEKDIMKKKQEVLDERLESETDNENLTSGPPRNMTKPEIVPFLNLENLNEDSSSSESYSDSSESINSNP